MRHLALTLATLLATTPLPASAQTLTTLFSFGGANGEILEGGVILDSAGNLFGTTRDGGASNSGTVFRLSDNGAGGYTHTTLLSFTGLNGRQPFAGLTLDPAGNLLGTTSRGGASDAGTVFRLSDNGAGGYAHTTLLSFNGDNGSVPYAGLTLHPAGDLFGTTYSGGDFAAGTVFRLSDNGAGGYTHTTLHSFTGPNGRSPFAGLTLDAAGNLFGTTRAGGTSNFGTVFRLSDNGAGGYTHTTLLSFNNTNGRDPFAGLTLDPAGNLFGTTRQGGVSNRGTVFRLSDNGAGGYTHSTLFSLSYPYFEPYGGLIIDAVGNIFGTTRQGGLSGGGTIFRLSDNGAGEYTDTTLYSFDIPTGVSPRGDLVADAAGNLYGTTEDGGSPSYGGTVFRLSNAGFVVASNEAPTSTPEPASVALLSLAVLSLAATRRRHPAAA